MGLPIALLSLLSHSSSALPNRPVPENTPPRNLRSTRLPSDRVQIVPDPNPHPGQPSSKPTSRESNTDNQDQHISQNTFLGRAGTWLRASVAYAPVSCVGILNNKPRIMATIRSSRRPCTGIAPDHDASYLQTMRFLILVTISFYQHVGEETFSVLRWVER